MLYDSLHNKLLKLPDEVLVYPAHGAGSLCGRNMRAERSSTIGTERLTNYALQIQTREEFVRQLTSNLPARPEYFLQDAEINRGGAPALSDLPELKAISPAELKAMLEEERDRAGYPARRTVRRRPCARFHQHCALSGQFATWAGTILGLSSRPVLIADTPEQLSEARLRLARVGIEGERGYLEDGVRDGSGQDSILPPCARLACRSCTSSYRKTNARARRSPRSGMDGRSRRRSRMVAARPVSGFSTRSRSQCSFGRSLPERLSQRHCLQSSATRRL